MAKNYMKELEDELKMRQAECDEAERKLQSLIGDEDAYYAQSRRLEVLQAKVERVQRHMIPVGAKVSISPYTDWHSYTIIKRTKDTLTARADRQTNFKVGYADGERNCEPDPNGEVITLRWSQVSNRWCYGIYRVMMGEYNYEDPSF